jgi:hypothetical protein
VGPSPVRQHVPGVVLARASVSSGVDAHLHFFPWQVLGELIVTVARAVAEPPSPVQVTEYEVVTVGETTAEPDVADALKWLPVQDDALIELHDRVEDCPALTIFGLAEREAVVAGGGVVNEPAVHGVSEPLPQQVLKISPFTGEEGFEVSPYGSCMMTPLADSERFGFRPLASTGSNVVFP